MPLVIKPQVFIQFQVVGPPDTGLEDVKRTPRTNRISIFQAVTSN